MLGPSGFDTIIDRWLPLAWALNMVNRSMGRDDLYPFVLPTVVLDKMRFIHTMIDEMAFQHVAEAGDARATMEAIADGLEVSSGGESPSHDNISRSSAPVMHAAG